MPSATEVSKVSRSDGGKTAEGEREKKKKKKERKKATEKRK
jgi:hypothetical protein